MNWLKVTSSALDSVAYDDKTELLQVKFKNGNIYTYDGVKPMTFQQFMKAPSKRGYLNQFVHGKHKHSKELKKK